MRDSLGGGSGVVNAGADDGFRDRPVMREGRDSLRGDVGV
jgi:hypothetical protein